jgi:TetR/AcrR family transcriptional regulator
MPRPASDLRARITLAARKRFLLQGVDGATLRSIASDAGTSIGMVYYYFQTKDELFSAVVEQVYVGLLADLSLALGTDAPPERRLARLFERLARLDEREFDIVRLVMREALVSSERLQRVARQFAQGHAPMVLQALSEGVASGRFDARLHPTVLAAATASLALLPQVLHRLVTAAELPIAAFLPSREEAAHALTAVLLRGIAGGG